MSCPLRASGALVRRALGGISCHPGAASPNWIMPAHRHPSVTAAAVGRFLSSSSDSVGDLPPTPTAAEAGFNKLLDATQRSILKEERNLLHTLHTQLLDLGTPADELQVLRDTISQMDELFMVCVVGEFNAGKSSFINALLGSKYVAEGVLPTTAQVCVLKYGEVQSVTTHVDAFGVADEDVQEMRLPVSWLSDLAVVDTPGTNAVISAHEQLTRRIVPRADLVLFVTSSDRPFSESEKNFLELIKGWGKKVVFVVNKIDNLPDEDAVKEVTVFVRDNGTAMMGGGPRGTPPVFPVSSREALRAKLASPGDPTVGAGSRSWEASRFDELEAFMTDVLSKEERVNAKMLSPLGVADSLLDIAEQRLEQRQATLASDLATIELVDENMKSFRKDMDRDVAFERLQIEKALDGMVRRADTFFSDRMTLFQLPMLMDADKFRAEFQSEVMTGVTERLDEVVADVSTLVEDRARNQARAVLDFLGRRPGEHSQSIVGTLSDHTFEGVRYKLLNKLSTHVGDVMNSYDAEKEGQELMATVKSSIMQTAVLEAGALSVGGLIAAHVLDFTGGIAAAGSLAVLGTMVIPLRRRRQQALFKGQVATLQTELDYAIAQRLERELQHLSDRILESITPYARFVKLEEEKIAVGEAAIRDAKERIKAIRSKIVK